MFRSIVNAVCFGDCEVAKLSNFVLMMVRSEAPPNVFLLCFAGASVVCSVCEVGAAEATLVRLNAPTTPATAPIKILRFLISVPPCFLGLSSCSPTRRNAHGFGGYGNGEREIRQFSGCERGVATPTVLVASNQSHRMEKAMKT